MNNWWQKVYLGNSVEDWLIALGVIVLAGIVLYALKKTVIRRLKKWSSKTDSSIDDIIVVGIERSVMPLIYFLIVYAAINYLSIPEKIMSKVKVVVLIMVMFYILRSVTAGVKHFIFGKIEEQTESEARKKQANGLVIVVSITIWILGFVFLLDNLGYNIGTLIAGLGIGGIAIALAAQTILGDLFSYFIIYFDKPFEIGDFINFDDKAGSVEYIGLKTTRIRTLSGEQLICSNKDLTDSRIHNFKRLERRRVVFKISIIYQTAATTIKEIPALVKNIIEQSEDVLFDRGHFMNIGPTTIDFEFVYYVLNADYTLYMDRQQNILLSIFEIFEKKKIKFSYPTQTLYLEQQKANANVNVDKPQQKGADTV
ncbi:MAG: mechanosensitive ion channel family protein [Ginsengibacter sp.]